MEYLGVQLEESEAWVVSAFKATLNKMQAEGACKDLKEEQQRALFTFFYSGALYGEKMGIEGV